jgi:hypothetical protein
MRIFSQIRWCFKTGSLHVGSGAGADDRPGTGSSARNFLHENKAAAAAAPRAVKAEARRDPGEEFLVKPGYGQVPTYLLERKMELAAEEAAKVAAREAALIPPGGAVDGVRGLSIILYTIYAGMEQGFWVGLR